ncbi:hypothetical protein AMATHDRAFT_51402 [Amanita thiersii Skay4041]|uniref:MYND-type domain-containing protein n=1 Tax=Amanita thiersii Skay4041 TaxID=703135 RepID=A0A2A9NDP8_9AGAR|nr:hypothetical protein AMATHDRAFT_51402 [Amanita thiersii Skay4041]
MSSNSNDRCAKCNFGVDRVFRKAPLKACSKCKTAQYCSKECQTEHWPIHRPMCKPHDPQKTWGIQLLCKGEFKLLNTEDESARFKHIHLPNSHPVFTIGELCPVPALCGFPLLIFSPGVHLGQQPTGEWENQPAVYLRIEPKDAFAPMPWQMLDPGTCILARKDHKSLTKETIEAVWKWTAKIIDAAGYPTYDGWAPIRGLVNPATFQMFTRDYFKEQKAKGRKGFDEFWNPL